jgi:hypothetical protein
MKGGLRMGNATTAIVQPMLPLAAVGGTVVIGVAVSCAGVLVWWLLRGERRDELAEAAERETGEDAQLEPPEGASRS